MGRKTVLKTERITVLVEGEPIKVSLHPPNGRRKSWYVYWKGLISSKSTEQSDLMEAIRVAESMVRSGGQKPTIETLRLTDGELIEIQRKHFSKKTDPESRERSMKSLRECLAAISAFQEITGLSSIALATPADCERFQQKALLRPKNWRIGYSKNRRFVKKQEEQIRVAQLSPNTVIKWSVALQAAFARACKSSGKKCVRGVVVDSKLLESNPWLEFTWIQGTEKKLRQFDQRELVSLLEFLEHKWSGISMATVFVKIMLWSWARRMEVSSLKWAQERRVGLECHFESTGKWGVTKWFRIPESLRTDLELFRTNSEFVFGGFPQQLSSFHLRSGDSASARQVRATFAPENLGDWMYHRIKEWSATQPCGTATAYLHVFRKTSLQYAVTGEHLEKTVAKDASVSKSVLMTNYARIEDAELRERSNRTYQRIRNSLSAEVASRYGWETKPTDRILERLDEARLKGDWESVVRLAQEMVQQTQQAE